MAEDKKQIKFKDLSPWLKVVVVFGFIDLTIAALYFLVGVFIGMGVI